MRRLQTYQRTRGERGCGQGNGGQGGVAYYTESVNSNLCWFKVWERDICTTSLYEQKFMKQLKPFNNKGSPIFSNFVGVCHSCAKYRTCTFSLIVRPLFPCFLHHYCLQVLYATNFLKENGFSYLQCITTF